MAPAALLQKYGVFKNGILEPDSIFYSPLPNATSEQSQCIGHCTIAINPGDIVEIRNVADGPLAALVSAGTTPAPGTLSVGASCNINKVG